MPDSVVRLLAEVLDHARRGEHVRVIADVLLYREVDKARRLDAVQPP